MNWPGFALITYAFLLALLLTVLVLRSRRSTKARYQRLLEEKEQKLTAMQMDLDETLQALTDQAADMEAQWALMQRQEQDTAAALQERIMEMQGTMMELQSRLLQVERTGLRGAVFSFPADREPRRISPALAEQPAPALTEDPVLAEPAAEAPALTEPAVAAAPAAPPALVETPAPPPLRESAVRKEKPPETALPELTAQAEAPGPAEPPRPRVEAMKIEARRPSSSGMEPMPPKPGTARQAPARAGEAEGKSTALELLEAGWSADRIARALRCSRVEVDMLATQWKRGQIRGGIDTES